MARRAVIGGAGPRGGDFGLFGRDAIAVDAGRDDGQYHRRIGRSSDQSVDAAAKFGDADDWHFARVRCACRYL